VLGTSSAAAYLIMIVVGNLISCEKETIPEICLDVKPKPIPLREIISRLVLGSQNIEMIGKPKFFIFIHDETHVDEIFLETDAIRLEEVKILIKFLDIITQFRKMYCLLFGIRFH
jgi:hypothetical protein